MQNLKIHYKTTAILFGITLLVSRLTFAEVTAEKLLEQPTPPTVEQIKELLSTGWKPNELTYIPDLPGLQSLPRDPQKADFGLQSNYPKWFEYLIKDSPRMIATFESQFPGAKWAFIGRDTWIFHNLFKAFYQSIGQQDRVVHIEMSKELFKQVKTMNNDVFVQFLQKKGLQIKDRSGSFQLPKYPFILVDSISSGNGSQGRHFIQSVYSSLASHRERSDLLPYFNFIGLIGSTSYILETPLAYAYYSIHEDQRKFSPTPLPEGQTFGDLHRILTYRDSRYWLSTSKENPKEAKTYLGGNEAGYTHWTGAWHGPYSSYGWDKDGVLDPIPNGNFNLRTRQAMLDFHAQVIQEVMSETYRERVFAEAKYLGFKFPKKRPTYYPALITEFKRQFLKLDANNIAEFEAILDKFFKKHRARVTDKDNYYKAMPNTILDKVRSLSNIEDVMKYLTACRKASKPLADHIRELEKNTLLENTLLPKVQSEKDFSVVLEILKDNMNYTHLGYYLQSVESLTHILNLLDFSNMRRDWKVYYITNYGSEYIRKASSYSEVDRLFSFIQHDPKTIKRLLKEIQNPVISTQDKKALEKKYLASLRKNVIERLLF